MKRHNGHSPLAIDAAIKKNLAVAWVSSAVFLVLLIPNLLFSLLFPSIYRGIITVLLAALLVQAVRSIVHNRKLRKALRQNPRSVQMNQVRMAPSLRGLMPFW